MSDSDSDFLKLTKKIVKNSLSFLKNNKPKNKNYYFDSDLKKEIKLDIDLSLNCTRKEIFPDLQHSLPPYDSLL